MFQLIFLLFWALWLKVTHKLMIWKHLIDWHLSGLPFNSRLYLVKMSNGLWYLPPIFLRLHLSLVLCWLDLTFWFSRTFHKLKWKRHKMKNGKVHIFWGGHKNMTKNMTILKTCLDLSKTATASGMAAGLHCKPLPCNENRVFPV